MRCLQCTKELTEKEYMTYMSYFYRRGEPSRCMGCQKKVQQEQIKNAVQKLEKHLYK